MEEWKKRKADEHLLISKDYLLDSADYAGYTRKELKGLRSIPNNNVMKAQQALYFLDTYEVIPTDPLDTWCQFKERLTTTSAEVLDEDSNFVFYFITSFDGCKDEHHVVTIFTSEDRKHYFTFYSYQFGVGPYHWSYEDES